MEEVRKEQPHLLMIQMLRLVNEEWELMSGKERSQYEKEAKQDQARFESEYQMYLEGNYSYCAKDRNKPEEIQQLVPDDFF